jgi:hypothetical protein
VILADDDERTRSTLRAVIEKRYPAARVIAEAANDFQLASIVIDWFLRPHPEPRKKDPVQAWCMSAMIQTLVRQARAARC